MYNKDQKEWYLDEMHHKKSFQDSTKYNFENVAEIEERLGKDISTFTFAEIETTYKMLNKSTMMALRLVNNIFSQYTDWCISNKLVPDSQNHFNEIKVDDYQKYMNLYKQESSIISREELLKVLSQTLNPRDKFIPLAIFEGIGASDIYEILNLRASDFKEDGVHLPSGRVISYSLRLRGFAEESAGTFDYIDKRGSERKLIGDYDDSVCKHDFTTHDTRSYASMQRLILRSIKRSMFDAKHDDMKIHDLIKSGRVNFINQKCDELKISGEEYLKQYSNEVNQRFCGIVDYKVALADYGFALRK